MRTADQNPFPRGQWEFAVGWTLNLHGNCGAFYGHVPAEVLQRFHAVLREKMERKVNLELIDWIWDQYAVFSPNGQAYSNKFRPTNSPDFKDAEEGCFGIPVK